MSTFAYKGYTQAGRAAHGLIEAFDAKEARERLAARGILAQQLDTAGAARSSLRSKGFAPAVRAEVYGELGILLESGLTLAQSLDLAISSPSLADASSLLAGIKDRVSEGRPLAEALSEASPEVSAFERALVESGERTGGLGLMLVELGRFIEGQVKVRERILSAMTYPVIVLVVSLAIALGVVFFLLPSLREMIAEANMEMPPITRFMLTGGQVCAWLLAGFAIALPLWALIHRQRMNGSAPARNAWAQRLFRLPLYGTGLARLSAMRFCRTLALMLKGGVPLLQALPLAGKATGNSWIEEEVERAAVAVRDGESLARSVERIAPFADLLPGWIQAGEAGGQLEALLDRAADRMQHQWERRIQKSLALLEPALIITVGVFVFLLALAVLLPILSLNSALQ